MLQNAIKFTPEGKHIYVETQLSFDKCREDAYVHEITVIDEGIGMSSNDAENVFTPFFRSESRENRELNTGGHGLGLSICMKIAK